MEAAGMSSEFLSDDEEVILSGHRNVNSSATVSARREMEGIEEEENTENTETHSTHSNPEQGYEEGQIEDPDSASDGGSSEQVEESEEAGKIKCTIIIKK